MGSDLPVVTYLSAADRARGRNEEGFRSGEIAGAATQYFLVGGAFAADAVAKIGAKIEAGPTIDRVDRGWRLDRHVRRRRHGSNREGGENNERRLQCLTHERPPE